MSLLSLLETNCIFCAGRVQIFTWRDYNYTPSKQVLMDYFKLIVTFSILLLDILKTPISSF